MVYLQGSEITNPEGRRSLRYVYPYLPGMVHDVGDADHACVERETGLCRLHLQQRTAVAVLVIPARCAVHRREVVLRESEGSDGEVLRTRCNVHRDEEYYK